jgi:hypothetical protein
MGKKKVVVSGSPLWIACIVLGVVFVVMKLLGVVGWPWLWVLCPFWVLPVMALFPVLLVLLMVFAIIAVVFLMVGGILAMVGLFVVPIVVLALCAFLVSELVDWLRGRKG